jgi:ribosome-associated toxin RatA of RatAB toxin-antitoxin module
MRVAAGPARDSGEAPCATVCRIAPQESVALESTSVEIRKSALIGHSAAKMFDLIEAAEDYPAFLPWCTNAVILARDDGVVAARITVNYHGLAFDLTTRNPKRRPHWMAIRLEHGPFQRFEGEWKLTDLAADACKIEFALRYEFLGALVGKLAGPVFDGIANTLIDAFANRANQAPDRPSRIIETDSFPTQGTPS